MTTPAGPTSETGESKHVVRIFVAASFLNDFGSDIVYPVWPLFLTSVMGANMAVVGLIDGLGEAVVSLSQAASGYLSDKFRCRKPFIWTGYLFGSVSRLGYALATAWGQLIPLRVFDRMGKIRSAPRDAIIADVSSDSNRGKNFGLLRTMDNLGAVCGIVFCIVFFDFGYRTLFLLAAIPSVVGAVLVFLSIREARADGHAAFKGISFRHLDSRFWLFLILSAIFALGSFSYSFLLLFAKEAGFAPSEMPMFYLIFTAFAAVSSLPFGRLSDRIGRRNVLLAAFVMWGGVAAIFLFGRGLDWMLTAFALYGLHKGALEPVQKTFVAELAPPELKASTLGGFQTVIGLCALPASLGAGLLWQSIDRSVPLYAALALTACATVLLLFVYEKRGEGRVESEE